MTDDPFAVAADGACAPASALAAGGVDKNKVASRSFALVQQGCGSSAEQLDRIAGDSGE